MSGKIYSYCRVGREEQLKEKAKEDISYEFLLNKPLYNNFNKIELPSSLQTYLDSSKNIKKILSVSYFNTESRKGQEKWKKIQFME